MPRLVEWPIDLSVKSQEPMSGPSAVTGGVVSITGQQQSISSPFGLWEWKLNFYPMQYDRYRRFRGFFAALQNGANATVWTPSDPDGMTYQQAGMITSIPRRHKIELPHSNGKFFTNGRGHIIHRPTISVGANAAKGDVVVNLPDQYWGHKLNYGDFVGFYPFHLGMYIVTERVTGGQYRIWPPLRKEIKTTDYATLRPTMAVRMKPGTGGGLVREPDAAQGMQMTVVEVKDPDVRAFYTR